MSLILQSRSIIIFLFEDLQNIINLCVSGSEPSGCLSVSGSLMSASLTLASGSKHLVSSVTMRRRHSSSWFMFTNRSWRAIFAWRSFVLSWHSEEPIRQRSEVECPGSMQWWRAQLLPNEDNEWHAQRKGAYNIVNTVFSLIMWKTKREHWVLSKISSEQSLRGNPQEKGSNRLHDDTNVHDNASSHSSSCARIGWQLWRGNFVLSSLISWSHSVWLSSVPCFH